MCGRLDGLARSILGDLWEFAASTQAWADYTIGLGPVVGTGLAYGLVRREAMS